MESSGVSDKGRTCIVLICNQVPNHSAHTYIILEEAVGFEPTDPFNGVDSLARSCLRPLSHASKNLVDPDGLEPPTYCV
jgi:hypothetical protein